MLKHRTVVLCQHRTHPLQAIYFGLQLLQIHRNCFSIQCPSPRDPNETMLAQSETVYHADIMEKSGPYVYCSLLLGKAFFDVFAWSACKRSILNISSSEHCKLQSVSSLSLKSQSVLPSQRRKRRGLMRNSSHPKEVRKKGGWKRERADCTFCSLKTASNA